MRCPADREAQRFPGVTRVGRRAWIQETRSGKKASGLLRVLVIAALAVLLAGCNGGTVDRHALDERRGDARLDRVRRRAARARRRSRARRRANFTREQAEELAIQASNLADALAKRHGTRRRSSRGCERRRRHAARLVGDAAAAARPPVRSRRRGDGRAAADEARRLPVNKVFGLALGILAAIGGFVDIGDLVFNTAAGAQFGLELIWVVVLGVGGIIVWLQQCAAASRRLFRRASRVRPRARAARLRGRHSARWPRRRSWTLMTLHGRGRRRRDRAAAPVGAGSTAC